MLLLEKRRDDLLRCKKITHEEVIEDKSLTLNTGEVIPQYFTQKHEKELKMSIGFSESESIGRGRNVSHGQSISFSEGNKNLFRGKEGTTRTYTDMEKEQAKELLRDMPDSIALVSMRMRGERFTPRMKTYHLDEKYQRSGSLDKRHSQAFENTVPYTTDAGTIDQEFWKRRQGFKIAPSPVIQPPQEEKEHNAPVPLQIVKRRVSTAKGEEFLPALSFGDNYLKLFYHFHYLTKKQVCRLLGKSENAVQTALVREYNNGLLQRKKITGIQKAGNVEFVYSLSTQKGTFSEHTLRVNDALITMVLAAKKEQSIRLVQLQHERYFKQHNIQVDNKQFLEPDAFLQFQLSPPFGGENESMGVCLEIDLGSEVWAQWQEKVEKYLQFASGVYQKQFGLESLTIAVCCPGGNTQLLRKWTKQALELRNKKEYAELFIFTDRNPVDCDPVEWLTAPVWTDIDNTPYALIEKPNSVSVKNEEKSRQRQPGILHLVKEDEPIQQVPDVPQPQDHPLEDTPVAPLILLGQNQQWRIYTNYKRYQHGIVQKPPDDRTRLEQIESLSETLQQTIRQGIPKSLDLQGAIIDYLCIREHQEALHLPATPVPVILIPYFQNIYYQELHVIVNRLAVFPAPAAPSSVQSLPTSDAQLEQPVLTLSELQRRYEEYQRDMRDMGRKPLAYKAWEKLELAKYAAENE